MNQPAKAQEPSMDEILASIRRIISDGDAAKPANPEPPPKPEAVAPPAKPVTPPPEPAAMSQNDIDWMLSNFDQAAEAEAMEPEPPPPPEPDPEPEPDVLELTEAMATKEPEPEPEPEWPTSPTIGEPDAMFAGPQPEPPPPPPPRQHSAPPSPPPASPPEPPILSAEASKSVEAAFKTLAHTVLVQNAREDLVREMLRPMIKTWLDDNLPGLVARLVRAEIERVSRGR